MDWWNSNYKIRRKLHITPTGTQSDYYGTFKLPPVNPLNRDFKIRVTDSEDLEVIAKGSESNFVVLPREIEIKETANNISIDVNFKLPEELSKGNYEYYLYYTNPRLLEAPEFRPSYLGNFFEKPGDIGLFESDTSELPLEDPEVIAELTYDRLDQEAFPGSSFNYTVTRPSQDWKNGISNIVGARAQFYFYGSSFRIYGIKSNIGGIADIKVYRDELVDQLEVDTYDADMFEDILYEYISSDYDKLSVVITVTGNKNPASSGTLIQLTKAKYRGFALCELGKEEIYESDLALRFYIGS